MARELRIAFDTGATVTSAVYNASGTSVATPTIAESPAGSGLYVGDFPAVTAGVYDVVYESGGYVVAGESIQWSGTAVVSSSLTPQNVRDALALAPSAGTPAAGSIDATLASLTAALANANITIASPVSLDGTLQLNRGDGYLAADGRAITFAATGLNLTGAAASLVLIPFDCFNAPITIAGTVASPASNPTLSFDIPSATTSLLLLGDRAYAYKLVATFADGQPATLQEGTVSVRE